MVTKLYLKTGEEYYLEYSFKGDECDIKPFQYEIYDKRIYLQDGTYELNDGSFMLVQDKKIIRVK